jgi:hypothetical protein
VLLGEDSGTGRHEQQWTIQMPELHTKTPHSLVAAATASDSFERPGRSPKLVARRKKVQILEVESPIGRQV